MNEQESKGEEAEFFHSGNIYGYPYYSENDWPSPKLFIDILKSSEFYGDYSDKAKEGFWCKNYKIYVTNL
ncbi:hypothetical protein ACQVUR_28295 [Bacillus mycoides]